MKPKLSTVKSSQDISDGSKTIRFYQKLLMNGTIPVGGVSHQRMIDLGVQVEVAKIWRKQNENKNK
jgi:hypothetical protein